MKNRKRLWLLTLPIAAALLLLIYAGLDNAADPDLLSHAQTVSRRFTNWCFYFTGLLCLGYWVFCGLNCGWRLPGLKLWPLMGGVLLLRGMGMHWLLETGHRFTISPELYFTVSILCSAVFTAFLTVLLIIALRAFRKCPEGMDCLIVLGCLSESPVLFARSDGAAEYMLRNPETLAIASGGQGGNESISEAESIRRRICGHGISESRVLPEDQSRNTIQNIRNSAALMPEKTGSVALVTDDYHQFRAQLIAKQVLGRRVYGLPVHTSRISLPHYMVKEFFSCLLLLAKTITGRKH